MVGRVLASALAVLVVLLAGPAGAAVEVDDPVVLVLFYGEGCPHCAAERRFLAGLQERQPLLEVQAHEVWHDEAGRALFVQVAAEHGIEPQAVPTTFLGDQVWVGFDDTVGAQIERSVEALVAGRAPPEEERTTVDVPLVGTVDVGGMPLVVATLVIGFVDGVNPCSLWVLSMLLALVLHSGSRGRVAAVGVTFLVVTATLYALFIAGLFTALDVAGEAAWIRVAVAGVAGAFGVLHLKEYVTAAGPSLAIPAHRKPGLYKRMRALADTDRSLPLALGGTVVLAVGVSLLETPCTAGLPMLWTNLVQDAGVTGLGWLSLLGIYLAVFLLDELLVFFAVVATMRATKLQEHHGRVLQLVSGTLMVTLALAMLLVPDLLETVAGTLAVFAAASVVVAVVLASSRWHGGHLAHR